MNVGASSVWLQPEHEAQWRLHQVHQNVHWCRERTDQPATSWLSQPTSAPQPEHCHSLHVYELHQEASHGAAPGG